MTRIAKVAIGAFLLVPVFSCSREEKLKEVEQVMDQAVHSEISRAVDMVGPTLGQMQDAGYTSWTPALAVEKLVPTLNSAIAPDPNYPSGGFLDQIKYVEGEATAPYQIVLTALGDEGKIKIEGYGSELEKPLVTRTIVVSQY